MGFRFEIKQNGEYENKSPMFKEMDVGESVTVVPIKVIKEGTASANGRSWKWILWNMKVNGEYCGGFAPATWMNVEFAKGVGKEFIVTRELNKEKGKLIWKLKKPEGLSSSPSPSTNFEKHTGDLKDPEDGSVYSDEDVVNFIKEQGKFDDMNTYITMWTNYGNTRERAIEVFNNRHKVI